MRRWLLDSLWTHGQTKDKQCCDTFSSSHHVLTATILRLLSSCFIYDDLKESKWHVRIPGESFRFGAPNEPLCISSSIPFCPEQLARCVVVYQKAFILPAAQLDIEACPAPWWTEPSASTEFLFNLRLKIHRLLSNLLSPLYNALPQTISGRIFIHVAGWCGKPEIVELKFVINKDC